MEASRFRPTDTVETYDSLITNLCWDDDVDKEAALSGGSYAVCGGVWVREEDNQWRFWADKVVEEELNIGSGRV